MKKFLVISTVVSVALMVFVSCTKDNSPSYPQSIAGSWSYTDPSSGYFSVLTVEDIAGGQYGYFWYLTPTYTVANSFEGSVSYDPASGKGVVSSGLAGGLAISVQAYDGDAGKIHVTASQVVSGGSDVLLDADHIKNEVVPFTTGQWTAEDVRKYEELSYNISVSMEITSLEPYEGKCGTLKVSAKQQVSGEEVSITTNITEVSEFIKISDRLTIGEITFKNTYTASPNMMAIYDPVSKDVTLSDADGMKITLKSVNIN